jgi:hypothetical protein
MVPIVVMLLSKGLTQCKDPPEILDGPYDPSKIEVNSKNK